MYKNVLVPPNKEIRLNDYDTNDTLGVKDKNEAKLKLNEDIARMSKLQDILYASGRYALLIILQAQDAAGKDSAIKHVMEGLNPQGVQVHNFKSPSTEELAHDFLWRCLKVVPEKGQIGIFNRSYYEEVTAVKVHPEYLESERLPLEAASGRWKHRYEDINNIERYLTNNGIIILKFFLHVSKETQKERLLARINTPEKQWKFNPSDIAERGYWNKYMQAYEKMINSTSTEWAPWHILPADHKWVTRLALSDIIRGKLEELNLSYPELTKEQSEGLAKAKEELESE